MKSHFSTILLFQIFKPVDNVTLINKLIEDGSIVTTPNSDYDVSMLKKSKTNQSCFIDWYIIVNGTRSKHANELPVCFLSFYYDFAFNMVVLRPLFFDNKRLALAHCLQKFAEPKSASY